ncbi:motility associated factor glycosyltransferase family protein [Clostridium sp. Marseille-P2415]|uniref:motility associated factor glycosyltransferase family protein n=1 Tax=Clostridium sp. Marseille-P2415 TaxID=1805471 RepID=UPI0009888248|nr:6-hydroxymethylpterin diphosphokinase MptE-like protein [Clostridium sp. Marseille-P2415]
MKKYKTLDGYDVYRIKKDKKFYFLADRLDYKKEINQLSDTLDDLKFDSLIFLFGIDTGEYIDEIKKLLCKKNRVIIFEPNRAIFKKYDPDIADNIKLVLFEEKQVIKIFADTINYKNINNVYFYAFGSYGRIYKNEYDCLVEHLDWTIINAASQVDLAKRFKKIFIQNMIANMKMINECTPIHHYMFTNLNVPAIVVSGGPSLDLNIKDMLLYKEKLKKCFIITGSRTVDALVKNGILPDMIVSVDPVEANYDMMKDHLDLDVPIAFYEYSNRYLIRDYKGDKIFISLLFSQTIRGFEQLKGVYCGGSVAHACIDIANMLGCSPIIFAGQDLAHTFNKHHADSAVFDYDKTLHYRSQISVKDVYGKQIGTTVTLDHYRRKLEHYINQYKEQKRIRFINCSYGADIKGAPHKEFSKVFEQERFDKRKKSCIPIQDIAVNSRETVGSILRFIDEYLIKAGHGLELCEIIISENQTKSLIEADEEDMDLQRILYILQIVNDFENAADSKYLGGYFSEFLYEMKEKTFFMYAKDYERLTSDLQHQAGAFKVYFEKMKEMLEEVKKTALETVTEFYKQHIVK